MPKKKTGSGKLTPMKPRPGMNKSPSAYKPKKELWPRLPGETAEAWRARIAKTAISLGNNLSSTPARKPHRGAAKLPKVKKSKKK